MVVKLYIIPKNGLVVNGKTFKATTIAQHFELNKGENRLTNSLIEAMKSNLTLAKTYYFSNTPKPSTADKLIGILGFRVHSIYNMGKVVLNELKGNNATSVGTLFDIHKDSYIILRIIPAN